MSCVSSEYFERIVAPVIDTVVSVGFGELEPAIGLVVGISMAPEFEVVF
jgi:hypothetical protein